jgi:hypothetical protein
MSHAPAYFAVRGDGSGEILAPYWSASYKVMKAEAERIGCVVTNYSCLRRILGRDPTIGLKQLSDRQDRPDDYNYSHKKARREARA